MIKRAHHIFRFRIVTSDVAQCHYDLKDVTAHRTDCSVYGSSRARDLEWCLIVAGSFLRTVLSTNSREPTGPLVSHASAFTVGNDLPTNPQTLFCCQCPTGIVPHFMVQCQYDKEKNQYSL